MEGETLETFYIQLVLMPKVLHYAQYVLLALGCVLLLIPIIYQIRSQVSSGQSMAWAEWSLACLLGGSRGLNQIPQLSLPAVPMDTACTLSLHPFRAAVLGLYLGWGAIHHCILAFPASSVTTSLPVLGGWGGPTLEGLQWFWIMRPGTRMVCSSSQQLLAARFWQVQRIQQ